MKNRLIFITDIHGHADELKELIAKVKPSKTDKFIFGGDYIDRGSQSKEVIEYLIEFSNKYECIFLMGNHEDMFLDCYYNNGNYGFRMYFFNGGQETLKSYNCPKYLYYSEIKMKDFIPEKHIDFIENLKYYYEEDNYIFVHAGIRPYVNLSSNTVEDLLWIRSEFLNHQGDFSGKIVVHGHTFTEGEVEFYENRINCDSGAANNQFLSAVDIKNKIVYQVKTKGIA